MKSDYDKLVDSLTTLAAIALKAWGLMWLWNTLFSLPNLTYWQAAVVVMVLSPIFIRRNPPGD